MRAAAVSGVRLTRSISTGVADPAYNAIADLAVNRLVMIFPETIARMEPSDAYGAPYGRVVYHGAHFRYSAPVAEATQALVVVSLDADEDVAIEDTLAGALGNPADADQAAIVNAHGHVLLPLFWAWAYGAVAGLPVHPAGELRHLFRRPV